MNRYLLALPVVALLAGGLALAAARPESAVPPTLATVAAELPAPTMGVAAAFGVESSLGEADPSAPVVVEEWPVPWERSQPRDPYVDGAGRVWFVGQRGDYAAYLDPATGEFRRFDLDRGTGPHNLIVDGDGLVWYAGNRHAHIGRLDPATGAVTRFPMPEGIRDPHTLV